MKIHRSKILKVIAAIVLVVCASLYWYYKEVEAIPFQYIWPMHLMVMAIGFIVMFGMLSDQKIIEREIGERLGGEGLVSRIRNQFLSSICMMPVLFISMLPAFGIMGDSINQGMEGSENEIVFVRVWLLFAILSFMYFLVAQPALSFSFQKIANKALKSDA